MCRLFENFQKTRLQSDHAVDDVATVVGESDLFEIEEFAHLDNVNDTRTDRYRIGDVLSNDVVHDDDDADTRPQSPRSAAVSSEFVDQMSKRFQLIDERLARTFEDLRRELADMRKLVAEHFTAQHNALGRQPTDHVVVPLQQENTQSSLEARNLDRLVESGDLVAQIYV